MGQSSGAEVLGEPLAKIKADVKAFLSSTGITKAGPTASPSTWEGRGLNHCLEEQVESCLLVPLVDSRRWPFPSSAALVGQQLLLKLAPKSLWLGKD